jgi:peptide/nickel transport system permease protein
MSDPPTSASFARRLAGRPLTLVALAWVLVVTLVAVFHGQLAPYDPLDQDLLSVKQWPSADHWLGTDALGRDVLSRLIEGTPATVIGVVEAVAVVAVLGIGLGLTAGFFRGAWDAIVRQYVDLVQSLPTIVILLAVLAVFGQSMLPAMVALGVLGSAGVARVLRSATLAVREELYISAARLCGLGDGYILLNHVLPRVIGPVVVQLALFAAIAVLVQTGVAFLGLGVQPPAPTWGGMIFDASASLNDFPWLLAPTGAVVALTILAFGLIGDGVRDASTEGWSRPAHGAKTTFAGTAAPIDVPKGAIFSARGVTLVADAGEGERVLVDNVAFDLFPGETLGIVGESGSGKTLTILALTGLLPPGVAVRAGWVWVEGRLIPLSEARTLAGLRGATIGAIFQDPMASLDPCFTVGSQLEEVLSGKRLSRAKRRASAVEALTQVMIRNPEDVARRYPHQISGGMAQRVGIARALMNEPRILFADEPTTALDVTVQAEILDLLRTMSAERRMAVVMVTHDWGVVADLCDRAMVMRRGRALETADVFTIFASPSHPYTRALIAANPHAAEPGRPLPTVDDKLVAEVGDVA